MGPREPGGARQVRFAPGHGNAQADTARQQDRPQKKATVSTRNKRLFTAEEAAAYLGYDTPWPIRTLMWNGELKFVKLSKRRIAFDIEDLDCFVEDRKSREDLH